MNDYPIHAFLMRMRTFNAMDVAVLFGMIAYREMASKVNGRYLVSPSVRDGLFPVMDVEKEELKASIERLIRARELEWVDDGVAMGFHVVRFNEFQDSLTEFGRRRYGRLKSAEHRDKKKELVS